MPRERTAHGFAPDGELLSSDTEADLSGTTLGRPGWAWPRHGGAARHPRWPGRYAV